MGLEQQHSPVSFSVIFISKSLLAGGLAGMCAKSSVAPLDRMKILLQAQNNAYKNEGVFSGLKKIVSDESFLALYKGNGAQMVRIFPYAATQFTSFEVYKRHLQHLLGSKRDLVSGLAGSMAGVTAVFLTYPLDTVRARLAFQVKGSHIYTGIVHALVTIYKTEGGPKALYRGFWATVCGMIPYAGLSFYCFESLKSMCMRNFRKSTCVECSNNTGGLVLTLPAKLFCGGIAGAVAQSFSYPADVTRRRMQLSGLDEKARQNCRGLFSTLRYIYKENGIVNGLYRGMSINYMRAIPMTAVSFTTYELTKQALGLDTGLNVKAG